MREQTNQSVVARLALAALLLAGLSDGAQAAKEGEADMTFKGTLIVPPPCTINGSKPIEVDFKQVETTKVNGVNYREPVPYTLSCTEATSTALRVQVKGTGAGFDANALQTSVADLGIVLQNNTTNLAVNSWLNFNSNNPPKLFAAPVKKKDVVLKGGGFTAAATMQVDYQ